MKYILPCILIVTIFYCISCKKFVDIPLPKDQISLNTIFKSKEAANMALAGLYAKMLATNLGIANGGATLYPGLSADEMFVTNASTDLEPFYQNEIPVTNNTGINNRLWSTSYRTIYHANALVEGLKNSILDTAFTLPLIAEAKLVRALHFHYLLNLFGPVPLILSTDYRVNAILPKASELLIYNQIIDDLLYAYHHLPNSYQHQNKTRPTKYSAAALLSRSFLYMRNWSQAQYYADLAITDGGYVLENNLNNVFILTSKESIWHLPKDVANTSEGQSFIPSSATARPIYVLSDYLLNAIDSNDKRKIYWTKANTVSNNIYYYPFKYKIRLSTPITEAYVVIRLAELFLIRAEARMKMGLVVEATNDLNTIRERAGLPKVYPTEIELPDAIMQERRVELFAEWGHRWFDLKRTNTVNEVLGSIKINWQPEDALYPIPHNEIMRNIYLIQNPGY